MKRLLAIALAISLTACSMAASRLIEHVPGGTCHSSAGQYHLSLSFIKIEINEIKDVNDKSGFYIKNITAEPKSDPDHIYCLDFLGSPTSEDTFMVKKDKSGLLERITSDAQDKSEQILKDLISTLFVGISENPAFDSTMAQARSLGPKPGLGPTKRFEAEWDPFNTSRAAVINDSIRHYGFCLVLEGNIDERFPSIQDYCDQPTRYMAREAMLLRADVEQRTQDSHVHPDPYDHGARRSFPRLFANGIYYRPRVPYKYSLYVKRNRQVAKGWQLRGSATVMLENRSPVLAVKIDRAFFANRTTTLLFEKGTLRDIEIKKDSELAAFANIPLTLAQSIAALPTNIIQIRIDATNNEGQLVRAQTALLEAERAKTQQLMDLETLRKGGAKSLSDARSARSLGWAPLTAPAPQQPATTLTGNVKFDQCMVDCKTDADERICRDYCNCRVNAGPYDQTANGTASHESCKQYLGN